jgi:uncharacterized protein YdhG (YjbR/CyaY superfamily)
MPTKKGTAAFTEEEQAAMKEAARERRAARSGKTDGLADVLAKIDEMTEPDRSIATRVHELVLGVAPTLVPRTWYGMPAYYKDGKCICFFQAAAKFKVRYATLGFQPDAALDDGDMWPNAYALIAITPETEARITELVGRAVS